jgi:hypothetical protein
MSVPPSHLNLAFTPLSNTIARFALAPLELVLSDQHIGEMLAHRRRR